MIKNTEGIVLKSALYGEADLIVTYLSRDFGIIKAFAKSPRKTTSRFGSSLEPLTYSRITLLGKENSNLPRLTRSDIIKSFQVLREDLQCFLDLSEIIKMNLSFIHEGSPVKELFELLYNTLLHLQQGNNRSLYLLFYKIKFLEKTGYILNLQMCGRCGSLTDSFKDNGNRLNFYKDHGTLLCESCCSEVRDAITIAPSTISFYKALKNWDIQKINRLKASKSIIFELSQLINNHICAVGLQRQ